MKYNPHELAERRVELSQEYFTASEQLETILSRKPDLWMTLRESVKSDKAADRAYEATQDGLEEMKLRMLMKRVEKKMSAANTYLKVLTDEANLKY